MLAIVIHDIRVTRIQATRAQLKLKYPAEVGGDKSMNCVWE